MIPALYFYVFSALPAESTHKNAYALVVGILAAPLVAFLCWWITVSVPERGISPIFHFLRIFLLESAIPFILLPFLLFFAFKSRFAEKNLLMVSLTFGIAMIFLPYIIVFRYPDHDLWASIMIPLCMVAYLFSVDFAWRKIQSGRPDGFAELFPAALLPLGILIIADGCKTAWYYNFSIWTYWPVSIFVVALALSLRLYKYFK